MATTKPAAPNPTGSLTNNPSQRLAMLTIDGTNFAIGMDDALTVMNAMANAEKLSYDYGASGYKLARLSSTPAASVATLSQTQWAAINLAERDV